MSAPPQKPASLGAALCLTTVLVAGAARAQEAESLAFSWQAPVGCPSSTEVRAEIARLLGGSLGSVSAGRLQAQAVVSHEQAWTVVLETESAGQAGRRSLEAASCRELANATALILALMIDPDAVAAHSTAAEPEPPPAPPEPSPPTAKPPRTWDYAAGIIVAGSQGTLPSPDVGVGGILGLAGQAWRVDLRASYGLRRDQKATAPLPLGGYGQFNFFSVLLAGCYDLGGPRMAWGPCAVGELGVVSAKGVAVDRALPENVPWWALGAGGYAAIALSRHWALPIHLEAMLPLRRSDYVFRDNQGKVNAHVFKAAPVGVRASAGIELHF